MKKAARGFTLIELLMAMAVLAAISTMVIIQFRGTQAKARDAKRKSELKQFQNLIEIFAGRNNGFYVSRTNTQPSTTICSDMGVTDCVTGTSPYTYNYQSNGSCCGAVTGTEYFLFVRLEGTGNSNDIFVICSNGKSGVGSLSSVPFAGGACPI